MIIRFTMFPLETALLPIYERLIACQERAAARALRALLYLDGATALPPWFEQMPRKPFPGTRGKTIRLSIPSPSDEPALAYFYQRLEPLSNAERINTLKSSLHQMLTPPSSAMSPGLPALLPEPTVSVAPIQVPVDTPDVPESATGKLEAPHHGKLKKVANSFR